MTNHPRTSLPGCRQDHRPRKSARLALGLAAVLIAGAGGVGHAQTPDKLPVFQVAGPTVDQDKLKALLGALAPGQDVVADPNPPSGKNSVALRAGDVIVDADIRSGGIFLADTARLWRAPKSELTVPDPKAAKSIADKFLKTFKLLGPNGLNTSFVHAGDSATMGGNDVKGKLDRTLINRQINYAAQITVTDAGGKPVIYPVVGGGGQIEVNIGDEGRVVGFSGAWRRPGRSLGDTPIISADEAMKKVAGDGSVSGLSASLAYYAPPAFERQKVLAPVWVVNGIVLKGDEKVPIRSQIVAATTFGPVFPVGRAPKPHPTKIPPPSVGDEKPTNLRAATAATANPFECGTDWIGTSQGLSGSSGNRQGFLDNCRSAGWLVNFDWGDANAWESDFNANDDTYVDAADLVFYTGHANQNGWVVNLPSDTFFDFAKVAGATDKFGANDLEWLIIAACGPLQSSHFVGSTTNAFDRWRPIFDGLHVFLGYGAITYDNTDEGRRFMELSRAGWNVIDAWFRTAQEIQPSSNGAAAPNGPTIFVVAMYAHNGDHCARNDHLWGMGSTCADVAPGGGQQRYMLWSGT